MLIAQLTDTHVTRPERRFQLFTDAALHLRRAVAAIGALRPAVDAVIVTGDVADTGDPREYRRAREILDGLTAPYFVVPGNHDRLPAFREAFHDHRYLPPPGAPLCYAIDDFPVRLVGLDSTLGGAHSIALDGPRLQRLEALLDPARPTLTFFHQPPLRTGMRFLDAHRYRGVAELAALVRRHPEVVRIVCGHIHRAASWRWNGTVVSTSVSTAPTFVPELFDRKLVGFTIDPPGFALHRFRDGAFETATIVTSGSRRSGEPAFRATEASLG